MQRLTIVKVGGAIVEDDSRLSQLLVDFKSIEGLKILIHGGGRLVTKIASRLGFETHMVNGRRITDAATLRLVTMVYGGLVNKSIVARLQAMGVNALGLTGADMDIIRSHKRPSKDGIDYGYVGDVDTVDAGRLASLLSSSIIPIIAPLTHDGDGNMLNTNADTMACETSKALSALYDVTLVYSFEKKGVLADSDDENSVLPIITRKDFPRLVDSGIVSGGMIPKVENALSAIDAGVKEVIITLATSLDGTGGTRIIK